MVLLTVYHVGYGEVHPIDTTYLLCDRVPDDLRLHGDDPLTGALIQFLTITQIRQILGSNRMQSEIDKLKAMSSSSASGASAICWRGSSRRRGGIRRAGDERGPRERNPRETAISVSSATARMKRC